ncbi:MAG: S1 RNA-binding domain-containing protein [Candidatus Lokiarchaeota archaeon]|nr:S1 RNA-binding domain-containing protein [Candidatus Lokiarchaeota archaeon]
MVRARTAFPSTGDFIIGKIVDIKDQYVYVDLIDYEGLETEEYARGLMHISEISSRWIKNIRNFVRVGQKVVLRVLRVDERKGHIDLSLRRVNSAQKEARMKEWKYALKYENLLQFLADDTEIDLDKAYEAIGWPVLDYYDSYQEAIEELKENGEAIMKNIDDVAEEVKQKFIEIVDENVSISTVSIIGKVKLKFNDEDGIEKIKDALIKARSIIDSKPTRNLEISYIAAPFYRLEIVSKDYLDAENILSDALEIIEDSASNYGGEFEFVRD